MTTTFSAMEEIQQTNPFAGYNDPVSRVFDENKQAVEYMKTFVQKHEVMVENEFYVLFDGNVLCKKGRSGVKTSDYLKDSVKPLNIKKYYEQI